MWGPRIRWPKILLVGVSALLTAHPAVADFWYEHYARAEQALDNQDWLRAVEELNGALGKKGDSGARVRSYGMKVTAYFPYLKLGIAYYHLGRFDAALQAFDTETQLGAIADSPPASAELDRFRALASDAHAAQQAAEQRRIREIVAQALDDAQQLEIDGLLGEAMAALSRAEAVAPDDADVDAVMSRLRERFAQQQQRNELDQRHAMLVARGRDLLGAERFTEAASALGEALALSPDAETQAMFDMAQRGLLDQIGPGEAATTGLATATILQDVRELEAAGRFAAALERLQAVLATQPDNDDARTLQSRLLQARREAESTDVRRRTIEQLLTEVRSSFDAGSAEGSLAAANRVLALDPGNATALHYVAQAYGQISRSLLGAGRRSGIPPAVRFVDLRREQDDGALVQVQASSDFRLSGVVIDDSPVDILFNDSAGASLPASIRSQHIAGFYLTEFDLDAELVPGLSTYRLVATDTEGLVSSSEYAVLYERGVLQSAWFYALLASGGLLAGGVIVWRRARHRALLRTRRFNPYVAGAPVLDDGMFFGRRELVDRILQTIHNNSLLIYGERRIGKTSIQHQLKKRLLELDDPVYEFHPVYVDLQGTPETGFFRTIAEDIYQELAPLLGELPPPGGLPDDYSHRDFARDLRSILRTLKERTHKLVKLVLLIDEVDELNAYDPRINQKLRSLFMKSFAENLAAVVSGVEIKKRWEREGSPWYNFFEEIEVEPLAEQDARELIERPLRGLFSLDPGAVDRIVALSGGKPYLVQKICMALVTRLHETNRRRATVDDVEAVHWGG